MKAFLLVDIQNDFLPGGPLAVPEGHQIIPVINRLQPCFELVVACQDWHPAEHVSFASNHPGRFPGQVVEEDGVEQILWPDHCVEGTPGAELHRDLDKSRIQAVFQKGTDPRIDSYSAFFDNARKKATGLGDFLQAQGVRELYVAGLATDYCVRFTALDAVSLGLKTHVVLDACRGVELQAGDVERSLESMREAGVSLTHAASLRPGRCP